MQKKIIAIDGPAGAGKTTIAKKLAEKIEFKYIDSGIFYRAIAYFGVDRLGSDFPNKLEIVSNYFIDSPQTLQLIWSKTKYHVLIAGEDVTSKLRDEKLNDVVTIVSNYRPFRDLVNKMIFRLGTRYDLVVDGRDIGTVVFPQAWKKIFCTADIDVRAKRRAKELNININSNRYDLLLKSLKSRDHNDETREIAPLIKAKDAVLIDTSSLEISDVVEKVYKLVFP